MKKVMIILLSFCFFGSGLYADPNEDLFKAMDSGYGDADKVQKLIDAKIDVNAKDNDGNSAIIRVTQKIKTDKEQKWLFGEHPRFQILKRLIKAGGDVNAKDKTGRTALMWAVQNKSLTAVNILIEAKIDINAQDNNGNTALMGNNSLNSCLNADIIEVLYYAHADLNAKNISGMTALKSC